MPHNWFNHSFQNLGCVRVWFHCYHHKEGINPKRFLVNSGFVMICKCKNIARFQSAWNVIATGNVEKERYIYGFIELRIQFDSQHMRYGWWVRAAMHTCSDHLLCVFKPNRNTNFYSWYIYTSSWYREKTHTKSPRAEREEEERSFCSCRKWLKPVQSMLKNLSHSTASQCARKSAMGITFSNLIITRYFNGASNVHGRGTEGNQSYRNRATQQEERKWS